MPPTPSIYHGTLPAILDGGQGYPTGPGELDELDFEVLCAPGSREEDLAALGLVRGEPLPASFGWHAMFVHAIAPAAVTAATLSQRVLCRGLLADDPKSRVEVTWESGYYVPTTGGAPVFTTLPAIIHEYFVTTYRDAYEYTRGEATDPPLRLPEPYAGLVGREWVLNRRTAQPVYLGSSIWRTSGLWRVVDVLWYVPTPATA